MRILRSNCGQRSRFLRQLWACVEAKNSQKTRKAIRESPMAYAIRRGLRCFGYGGPYISGSSLPIDLKRDTSLSTTEVGEAYEPGSADIFRNDRRELAEQADNKR